MTDIDTLAYFDGLASEMNASPERFDPLGDIELDLAVVMERAGRDPFAVLLGFRGIGCESVAEIDPAAAEAADCYLLGDLDAWTAMFDNIVAEGGATGRWTLNSLSMVGDVIGVHGDDPMRVDRFFRFNQTLQEFFDGAARVWSPAAA